MTNNVNGVGINTNSVNPYGNPPQDKGGKPEEKTEQVAPATPQTPQVNPDDVLAYMANQAVVVNPKAAAPQTYDVGKYVTPEQAERIAGFVAGFEDQVAKGLLAIDSELGDLNLPDDVKNEIAAGMV